MVADNKKQSTSDNAVDLPKPNISNEDDFRTIHKLSFRAGNYKRIIVYALIAIAILVGGFIVLKHELHIGEKVYAQAGGHKIYQQDVENLIGNNKGINKHDAARVLADKYLIKAMVKGKDITVTEKDLVAQYGNATKQQKSSNKYIYQNKENQLYLQKIQVYNYGIYKGKYLIGNFSRHVEFQPVLPEDKIHDPNLGKPAAIAKDKAYAQDFLTQLYDQIKSGKITFDQAIQKERNNPKIGVKAYPSLPHSGPFDTSSGPNYAVLKPTSTRQKINDIKEGEITAPFVVRVGNSLEGNSTAESYFLVVDMEKSSHSYTDIYFTQYLEQAKQKFGYKVYV